MEGGIDADAPLDYATIQIFPTQNRYDVFVCGENEIEKLAAGVLEQLLPHLPEVNNLYAEGSNANFKLQVMGELNRSDWFTKSTLNRFLRLSGSPNLVNSIVAIDGEMSQLEETRNFHLSLYSQVHCDHIAVGETDGCNLIDTAPKLKTEVKIASSDSSKNELLRAMDLRLVALKMELTAALNQAAGAACSSKEINDLIEFCEYFRATDLKNCLGKFLELSQKSEKAVLLNNDVCSPTSMTTTDTVNKTDEKNRISRPGYSETPVKYGVSPAAVAQIERQSSSASEQSSDSNDANQESGERSRSFVRSAPLRRSASPMRRVQIGRTGSRRATAIAIKSLSYYPARERASFGDVSANGKDEEVSEQPSEKVETNVKRMSVQDAISLFESKQKDRTVDVQKKSSLSNISLCTNKSVLRRWSAGVAEYSSPCQPEPDSEDSAPVGCNDEVNGDISTHLVEENLESDFTPGCQNPAEASKISAELGNQGRITFDPLENETTNNATLVPESNGRSKTSSEWIRHTEAEMNKMLMKVMESQPAKNRKSQTIRKQSIPSKQRGGSYDHYKEKREEKLRRENPGKKAEKEAQFRVMQQTFDKRKAEMASPNVKDVGKRAFRSKPQKPSKHPSQSALLKAESPKTSTTKRVASKTSTLADTRKSWPPAPLARMARSSPSKSPVGTSSAGAKPAVRKPQSTPTIPQKTSKAERSQPRNRTVKEAPADADRSLKGVKAKMQQTKNGKITKTKIAVADEECSSMVPSKTGFYNKMAKKSSIVPLESKPFLRKGSRGGPGVGSTVNKAKNSSQLEESSISCREKIETQATEVVLNSSVSVSGHQDQDTLCHFNAATELETVISSHQSCDDTENRDKVAVDGDDGFEEQAESSAEVQPQEESIISPSAWVEIEDELHLPNASNNGTPQLASPVHAAPAGVSSPYIRHSLSQMLLEEDSNEPDTDEWGNAENPPAMLYPKDARKGLKRLLKFARKSKGEANLSVSSPSIFSEGEDDAEESKAFSKRNTDNLLRKTALHSNPAQSNINKFNALHMGHDSTSASTTKATRSFFSLSAFRGSKPTDTKFH